jgi:hypothetical protein
MTTSKKLIFSVALAVFAAGWFGACENPFMKEATASLYDEKDKDGGPPPFPFPPPAFTLNSIGEIEAWIDDQMALGHGAAGDPIPLELAVNLDSAQWAGILSAIAGKDKYVTLNLTDCDRGTHSSGGGLYSGGTFDPGTANSGEQYVTALILPDAAESVEEGTYLASAFQHFTALKSVSGDNVTNIRQYAFYNCATLISADFPAATEIGPGAFGYCTDLTSVDLPEALIISSTAFTWCSSITSVYLPAVTDIYSYAFYPCNALTTVTINLGCSIDAYSFPNDFKNYYDTNGKLDGVYTWDDIAWSYAP